MRMVATCVGLAGVLALGACTVPPPTGPTVAVMPGQGSCSSSSRRTTTTAATSRSRASASHRARRPRTAPSAAPSWGPGARRGRGRAGGRGGRERGAGRRRRGGRGPAAGQRGRGGREPAVVCVVCAARLRYRLCPVHGLERQSGAAGERGTGLPGLPRLLPLARLLSAPLRYRPYPYYYPGYGYPGSYPAY